LQKYFTFLFYFDGGFYTQQQRYTITPTHTFSEPVTSSIVRLSFCKEENHLLHNTLQSYKLFFSPSFFFPCKRKPLKKQVVVYNPRFFF